MAYLSKTADYVRAAVAAACLLLAGQAGCSSSTVEEALDLSILGQNCLVNSDCNDPLVCAFEACHAECVSSRDCDDGARCVAAARPYKVCQLEAERVCERKSDCAKGLVCGVDGECRDKCATDYDCVEDQLCVSGTCADRNELDQDGQLSPRPDATSGSEGSPCVYVSDCSAALLCRNQACLPECKADKDCGLHHVCQETRCVADGSQPKACSYTSDCDTESGERCLNGGCLCSCVDDRDCPVGESCNGCGCQADPLVTQPCIYNSDCEKAGTICRDRQCSCECKTDLDCGADSKCDGCGCLPGIDPIDGVVFGRATVTSSLQLALYRGITEVRGDLMIDGAGIADLGDTFANLRRVDGFLLIEDNPLLETVTFPSLQHAGVIRIKNDGALRSLAFPELLYAELELNDLQRLDELIVDELVDGSIRAGTLPLLADLTLTKARNLYDLALADLPLLETLELPALSMIGSVFSIDGVSQPMLSTLSAPNLATVGQGINVGDIFLKNTKLSTLAGFGASKLAINGQLVELTDNALLGTCEVSAFEQRYQAADGLFKGAAMTANNCTSCNSAGCSQ